MDLKFEALKKHSSQSIDQNKNDKGGLVELGPLLKTFRCKLSYFTFSRNINQEKSIVHKLQKLQKLVRV